ncbi:MFS transporter [Actinomadura litoris]|uniref:MFS transporter n=1 Tax=Actinomadura litoris TaxID=2678616 RepID=UPI0027E0F4EC|nr:MFS transporter [Actinomadura litoris]
MEVARSFDERTRMSAVAGTAPRAGRREWAGLVMLCLPTMLATVDINVTLLALPHIAKDLGSSDIQQLWITDVYGFVIASFLITMGTLGDRIGRRRVLLAGAALFIVASVLAATAGSTGALIASRAVIGLAGATLMPSVLAIITDMFRDPKQLSIAMGAWGSSIMLGLIGGPIVGGLLLGPFYWGSVFLIAIPVMAVLLITGPFLIPESRNPDARRLDLVSVVLSLGMIMPVVYGIKELSRDGWAVLPVVAIVVGVVLGAVFVRRQRSITNPLLDLNLFGIRSLSTGLALGLLVAMITGGTGLTVTLFMQMVRGITPVHVALWLIAPSIAMVVFGNMALGMSQKIRPAVVLAAGSVVAIAGLLVLTQVSVHGGMGVLLTGLILVYVGASPVGMMNSFLVMQAAPPDKAGSAGSLSSTSGELGAALGVAVFGVVGTSVYRHELDVPSGTPGPVADAANSSIAGAVYGAPGTPTGPALLDSAEKAFTSGLHVVALSTIVLYIALAAIAYIGLRDLPPTGTPEPAADAEAEPAEQPTA